MSYIYIHDISSLRVNKEALFYSDQCKVVNKSNCC